MGAQVSIGPKYVGLLDVNNGLSLTTVQGSAVYSVLSATHCLFHFVLNHALAFNPCKTANVVELIDITEDQCRPCLRLTSWG